jgi:hypothetical protein
MLFEWMHFNKATSEATTKLSIAQVQTKIGEIFGLQDRQAAGIFGKLVESGHIGRWKGAHETKSWLEFTPELEGGVALGNYEPVDLKAFINKKIEVYGLKEGRGAGVADFITHNTRVCDDVSNKIIIINNNSVSSLASLAPLEGATAPLATKKGEPCHICHQSFDRGLLLYDPAGDANELICRKCAKDRGYV